jgi:predicted  nucleic acid-binding Zn-ribbon protein
MMRNGEGGLDAASQRLMQAVERLEARLQSRPAADAGAAPADDGERERLHGELQTARERERALEAAAAEASAALGRAAEQIRTAIEEDEEA